MMVRFLDVRNQPIQFRHQPRNVDHRAQDFVNSAFPVDRKNTRYVSLVNLKAVRKGWKTRTVTKIPGERARTYDQYFFPPEGYRGSFRACNGMQVDCSCKRMLYVWNFALDSEDLAIVDRTNGEPPDETNPEHYLGACVDGDALVTMCVRNEETYTTTVKLLKDVQVGDEVLTLGGPHRVIETHDMGLKPSLCITTAAGHTLKVTYDHRIRVRKETDVWQRADEIHAGDKVITLNPTQYSLFSEDTVALVQSIGDVHVYDIGVEEEENFIANNISVHNCKHAIVAVRQLIRENPSFPHEVRVTSNKSGKTTKPSQSKGVVRLRTIRG